MLHEVDLSRADLNLLVLFEAVLETRNVGRAAERLSLSPSAVSHGLSRLRTLLDDPLFLRTPKGVAPTARALELAPAIAEALARVRAVLASATPFDSAISRRRFVISSPDAVAAVILPPLLALLATQAPGLDIAARQILPRPTDPAPDVAWRNVFDELDARACDLAVVPLETAPARFHTRVLYEEDFVAVVRPGHPFAADQSPSAYCAAQHLLVSETGDPQGFVDQALAAQGLVRRVAVTVPNFMLALAVAADSDLIAAVPRRLAAMHGPRLGLLSVEIPAELPRSSITLVAPRVALQDAGLAWIADLLGRATARL